MLVLSRKRGEAIYLGDNIKITVLDTDSERASIGIEAPRSVVVLREELVRETKAINAQALLKGKLDMEKIKNIIQ